MTTVVLTTNAAWAGGVLMLVFGLVFGGAALLGVWLADEAAGKHDRSDGPGPKGKR